MTAQEQTEEINTNAKKIILECNIDNVYVNQHEIL